MKAEELHALLMDLVQVAGLLHPDALGVSMSQVFALHELDTDEPLSQQDLADRLHLEKSTVSRMVADMERAGLLVRERDPANRRLYRLRITDAGREMHARTAAQMHQRFVGRVASMTSAEHDALHRGLSAFVREMRTRHSEE